MDAARAKELVEIIGQYHKDNISTEKFTDDDVRAEPGLTDLALEWMAGYTGNSSFILDLRSKSGGALSVAQTRGVLNTMLAGTRHKEGDRYNIPYTGIIFNGYYLPDNYPAMQVRGWINDDKRRMLTYLDPYSSKWVGFASIEEDGTYSIWAKQDSVKIREYCQLFFDADLDTRKQWHTNFAELTGLCALCNTHPHAEGGNYCEACAIKLYGEQEN
jgi:hypothetical protein